MINGLNMIIAMIAVLPSGAPSATVQCQFSEKVQCDRGTPCKALKPSVSVKINFAAKQYSRCDKAGCDNYNAVISQSGAYKIIEIPGRAMFAKIGPNGISTEVVSIMNSVLVSQGVCK